MEKLPRIRQRNAMEIVYAAFVATSLTGRSNDRNRSRGINSNRILRLQSPKFVDIRCGRANDFFYDFTLILYNT